MNIINSQIFNDYFYQNTINSVISFNGVGIHSGKAVNLTLFPADEDFGIVFKRTDLDKNNFIKVIVHYNKIEKIILLKNIYINPKSFLILVAEIVSVYGK